MEQNKISEEEEEESCWSNLRIDILCMIKSYLLGAERIRFHAVCKAWNSVPSKVSWLSSPGYKPAEMNQWPSLIFLGRNTSLCNFFNPLLNTTHRRAFPGLSNAKIRFSKDGWLLMTQGDVSVMFFNPFTNEKIHLPYLPMEEHMYSMICFSSPPTLPCCVVLAVRAHSVNFVQFCFIRRGEASWREFEELSDTKIFFPCYGNPVFCNGALHCLSQGGLHIFDPTKANTEDSWIVLDDLKMPPLAGKIMKSYLTECDGELVAVFEGHVGKSVDVFKLDRSAMAWKRVRRLGNRMLFVSSRGSVSTSAKEEFPNFGMENKIYFPKFKGEDGVFYSLSTRKFHSFDVGYSAEDFYGTKEQMHSVWIQPNLDTHSVQELTWSS